jgi:hypothetical protein
MTPSLHSFYRKFEELPKEQRAVMIDTPIEPTSLFVIFKQLTEVRAQKKYFEDREAHLLNLAELGFEQIKNKK